MPGPRIGAIMNTVITSASTRAIRSPTWRSRMIVSEMARGEAAPMPHSRRLASRNSSEGARAAPVAPRA